MGLSSTICAQASRSLAAPAAKNLNMASSYLSPSVGAKPLVCSKYAAKAAHEPLSAAGSSAILLPLLLYCRPLSLRQFGNVGVRQCIEEAAQIPFKAESAVNVVLFAAHRGAKYRRFLIELRVELCAKCFLEGLVIHNFAPHVEEKNHLG